MSAVSYDHIVLGVGGMGSATLFELARRGHRVLGLERFDVPHAMGSSHGQTRIIRLAYNEHSNYVPLLQRAYELWDELETRAGEELLVRTGGLDVGPRDGRIVSGSLAACREHGLDHELMDAEEARRRYPGLAVDDTFSAVFQPDAGYLRPERCVVSYAAAALERGATIHAREPVVSWSHDGDVYRVDTTKGQYETPSLVVTAGPWAAQMIADLGPWARPQRQVVGWFQPHRPELFARDHLPVFILDLEEGEYYGFPIDSQMPGFKIGRFYHREQWVDPDEPRAEADAEDEEVLRKAVRRCFPEANGPTLALQTCTFTLTPDHHFILDLPKSCNGEASPGLVLGAGFSGHGFKFASVIGEILADLAEAGSTSHDVEMFSLARFEAACSAR